MPVKVTTIQGLTDHKHGKRSVIDTMEEFVDLRKKLTEEKLSPNGAIEIELPIMNLKQGRFLFKEKVSELLEKLNLTSYVVVSYKAGDKDYVTVQNPMPALSAVPQAETIAPVQPEAQAA